jgi:Cu2+-exporting ATPase
MTDSGRTHHEHHATHSPPPPEEAEPPTGRHHHGPGTASGGAGKPPIPAAHQAHDKHAGHSVGMFRDKFLLTLLLTIPTLIWGHMLPRLFSYTPPAVPGARWIPALFGTAVFFYGGRPFLQGAVRELRDRLPGMMTLIALAISVAFGFSAAVTLGFPGMPLWEELATLVTIMLLGHWVEMRSIRRAEGALAELAKLLPNTATRVTGWTTSRSASCTTATSC